MRQLYAYDANESPRRLVEERMSTGFTNTRTARGFSIVYHMFENNGFSVLLYVIKVALHYTLC